MAKLSDVSSVGKAGGMLKIWKYLSSFSSVDIERDAGRDVRIGIIGSPDHAALLAARLALESPAPQDSPTGPADVRPYLDFYMKVEDAPSGGIVLQADPLTANETYLAEEIAKIVMAHPQLRLSLARHIPAFRPAVTTQLINDAAWNNAKIAVASALPGIIPFTDIFLPAAALGDMLVLTRNQGVLLLKIAAAYGLPINLKARMRELLPIVGSAFGWRAVARELVGIVPGGVGVVLKGAIAYAGTYTVGKAAQIYYSTGQKLPVSRINKLYQDAYQSALGRVKQMMRLGNSRNGDKTGPLPPDKLLEVEPLHASENEAEMDYFDTNIDKPTRTRV